MLRLGAIFIVACMVLIAGSLGAALYLAGLLAAQEAMLGALAILMALVLYNVLTKRPRDRSDVGAHIADMSRGMADLSRQVAELGRRTAQLEDQRGASADQARAAVAPFSAELSELGTLVKHLAESVAVHEATFAAGKFVSAPTTATADPLTRSEAQPAGARGPATMASDAMIAAIRSAVDANRVDLYLQPIVTLPQRKVRYYEALTRLRTEEGKLLTPSEFLGPAETGNLLPRIDHMLLFRSVQVVRRLLLKNRDIGLFCNIAGSTLNEPQLFPQMVEFLEANRALASALVLEFKQATWRDMGPLEQESLAELRELGFRFCMDQVTDLRFEPRDLGERGVRFVKAPAALLLGQGETGSDIHAADVADLLNRHGIALIADRVETENQVIDLLDYELRFGQGTLFSPPRPVRAEALQTAAADAGEVATSTGTG